MRWTPSTTTGLACLIAGLVMGYFMPRQSELADADRTGAALAKHPAQAGPVYAYDFPKTESSPPQSSGDLLRTIPPPDNYDARSEWLAKLPTSDLPQLIAALCSDAGPEGVESGDAHLIGNALEKWWEQDSSGLLSWLRKLPNTATKRYLVDELLEDIAYDDSSRAKALAASFKASDPEWDDSEVLNSLVMPDIREAWKKPGVSAEEMLSLYKRLRPSEDTWGNEIEVYPANFDFRRFLDGMNALQQEGSAKARQRPSDIIEAWAKADPQAAAEWLVEQKNNADPQNSPHFFGWRSFAEGVSARSGPQAYHQWAAQMFAQSGEKTREMILNESSDEDVIGIIGSITDAALRDKVAFEQAAQRNDIDMFANFSTPEARLNAIAQDPGTFHRWITRGKADPSFWVRAGLTGEQVEAVLPDTPPPMCPHCGTAHY